MHPGPPPSKDNLLGCRKHLDSEKGKGLPNEISERVKKKEVATNDKIAQCGGTKKNGTVENI